MNDLEQEVRDTLLRHQADVPMVEPSDAPRVAGRAHRRQARNMVVVGIAGTAAVVFAIAGLGGLVRADRSPTVLNPPPSPPPMCAATAEPVAQEVHGWPGASRNPVGVYSWDTRTGRSGLYGFMHNAMGAGSGSIVMNIEGETGRLIPHRGQTGETVAGCEATYRRFNGGESDFEVGDRVEEWMLDIQGTTVTIRLGAKPGAPADEVSEAHEIIESIRAEPQDSPLGFRLTFTLATNTWDSG